MKTCISCGLLFWPNNENSYCSSCYTPYQIKIGKKEKYSNDHEYKEFKKKVKKCGKYERKNKIPIE